LQQQRERVSSSRERAEEGERESIAASTAKSIHDDEPMHVYKYTYI
jgi:hypothetical protein